MSAPTENGSATGLLGRFDASAFANYAAFASAYGAESTIFNAAKYPLGANNDFQTRNGVNAWVNTGTVTNQVFLIWLAASYVDLWFRIVYSHPGDDNTLPGVSVYGPSEDADTYDTVSAGLRYQVPLAVGVSDEQWSSDTPLFESLISSWAESITPDLEELVDLRFRLVSTVVDDVITSVTLQCYYGATLIHEITEDVSAEEWASLVQSFDGILQRSVGIARIEVYDASVNATPWGEDEEESVGAEVLAGVADLLVRDGNGNVAYLTPALREYLESIEDAELLADVADVLHRADEHVQMIMYVPPALKAHLEALT